MVICYHMREREREREGSTTAAAAANNNEIAIDCFFLKKEEVIYQVGETILASLPLLWGHFSKKRVFLFFLLSLISDEFSTGGAVIETIEIYVLVLPPARQGAPSVMSPMIMMVSRLVFGNHPLIDRKRVWMCDIFHFGKAFLDLFLSLSPCSFPLLILSLSLPLSLSRTSLLFLWQIVSHLSAMLS